MNIRAAMGIHFKHLSSVAHSLRGPSLQDPLYPAPTTSARGQVEDSLPIHGLHDLDLNLLFVERAQHPVPPVLSAFEIDHENLMWEAKGKETQVAQGLFQIN